MRVGRIPYINCYPVYGAIDRGIVPINAELVDGVPTALNHEMTVGSIDVSVISAVEYARDATKWVLGPYESTEISGWQVNDRTARGFFFTGGLVFLGSGGAPAARARKETMGSKSLTLYLRLHSMSKAWTETGELASAAERICSTCWNR